MNAERPWLDDSKIGREGTITAILRAREADGPENIEYLLHEMAHARRFDRLVFGGVTISGLFAILTVLISLRDLVPFPAALPRIDFGGWQLVCLVMAVLWLLYTLKAFRKMRQAEGLIVKSYLVDAWLERRSDPN